MAADLRVEASHYRAEAYMTAGNHRIENDRNPLEAWGIAGPEWKFDEHREFNTDRGPATRIQPQNFDRLLVFTMEREFPLKSFSEH